jgi:hypothetical protein
MSDMNAVRKRKREAWLFLLIAVALIGGTVSVVHWIGGTPNADQQNSTEIQAARQAQHALELKTTYNNLADSAVYFQHQKTLGDKIWRICYAEFNYPSHIQGRYVITEVSCETADPFLVNK